MQTVASRELRNQTRSILDRVATGEQISITVAGRPVAILSPIVGRNRWMTREAFLHTVIEHQADPDLRHELDSLALDTTDELPL